MMCTFIIARHYSAVDMVHCVDNYPAFFFQPIGVVHYVGNHRILFNHLERFTVLVTTKHCSVRVVHCVILFMCMCECLYDRT